MYQTKEYNYVISQSPNGSQLSLSMSFVNHQMAAKSKHVICQSLIGSQV